ncbi:UDP-N-acetylglucosamine--N-acetylmuramyl-(pentapeptide) pyrophosphoryl-undecaprenol N-acetylglucosamine transferase [Streptomyces silvisoli]|uniref:UDP-N-acetylglucosamine--N-acetylmuramyl-(pentapeptide) pyrophosphoryl-undecaprenol N-acetylglucosamine transferase n=1 Tax=Streptomyces silvisoli TaxID=3034235 RepID=A0ABT5ZVR2_9ACTN|nr:UDP-N-acetylglucosamine--N-acetylmuramyl-(pentapeptide) pyrophosphoryl-undecaprenol N-acetylglucosamine transferase [Streptomyces silvisoli]MDF3293911.1 UDP-N-acetylglucosamine--N-acetylmuramyl-(pentapeptide) pyrophosphoryl-undecaprenol N-acetylglucosamine transferase [Streptomyces silvisoli]
MGTHQIQSSGPVIAIGAGGTGGHIYPGLALAEAVLRAEPDATVVFTGTERGLETRLVPEAGYRLHTVDMIPFDRSLGSRRFLLPAALARSAEQARRILREVAADVAVGMGGYSSAPLIAGARLARIPSLIHESNAVPGRANRFSASLTPNIAVASRAGAAAFGYRCRVIGMPLLPQIASLDRAASRRLARRRFGVPEGVRLIVVNGGSAGAVRLNDAAVELAGRWRDRRDVQLLIKAGKGGPGPLNARIAQLGAESVAHAVGYLERIDLAYSAADLMVCRSGSATVAELSVAGVPAVLVPYPYAPGDHQTHNARELVDAGGAVLVPDTEATAERLQRAVGALLDTPGRLEAMAQAAASPLHAHAADELADWVLDLAAQHRHTKQTKEIA